VQSRRAVGIGGSRLELLYANVESAP